MYLSASRHSRNWKASSQAFWLSWRVHLSTKLTNLEWLIFTASSMTSTMCSLLNLSSSVNHPSFLKKQWTKHWKIYKNFNFKAASFSSKAYLSFFTSNAEIASEKLHSTFMHKSNLFTAFFCNFTQQVLSFISSFNLQRKTFKTVKRFSQTPTMLEVISIKATKPTENFIFLQTVSSKIWNKLTWKPRCSHYMFTLLAMKILLKISWNESLISNDKFSMFR